MQNGTMISDSWTLRRSEFESGVMRRIEAQKSDPALPVTITKAASKQTYYTIRLLVDRERVLDAYRAYAYFRWIDDEIDTRATDRTQRLEMIERQQSIIDGSRVHGLCAEEKILADLLRSEPDPNSGLHLYIRNMMAVMAFDADRRGRLISARELADYTHCLATAVTEALHYFIGHAAGSPQGEARYQAVTGAHITHMLRDAYEDVASGYFNVPREFLEAHHISPFDIERDVYREWVMQRVELARECFDAGRRAMNQVKNWRCRLAGYAYTARFEWMLDTIAHEDYWLRPEYPERKSGKAAWNMGWSALAMAGKGLV